MWNILYQTDTLFKATYRLALTDKGDAEFRDCKIQYSYTADI